MDAQALLKWHASGDTGSSSLALASEYAGTAGSGRPSHPRDGSDLGRCVRLINAVPGVRKSVDALAMRDPYWAALAPEWDRLVAVYLAEKDGGELGSTYREMRAVLDPVQSRDRSVIVLGKGVSVRMGK